MGNLLATKPLHLLMEEARETGEHSLKRTLGVFQLTALGVGAIIGAAQRVSSTLGCGFLEKVYENALALDRGNIAGARCEDDGGRTRL